MLEILILYHFGKKVGETAESKGYSGVAFTVAFVAMWFLAEAAVVIPGVAAVSDRRALLCGIYLLALVMAMVSGFTVYVLLLFLPDLQTDQRLTALDFDHQGRPVRGKRRRPRPKFDDEEQPRRRPRPRFDDDEDEPRPRRRSRAQFDDDDEEEEPRPRRRREPEFDDEDDPPSRKRSIRRPRREEFDDG
jgi:hypothetical protein